jgi:Na+/phosphate symporter
VKALEVYSHISCSVHNLNLVSKHSIESVENIQKFIDTIKSIVSKLKKNGIMKKLEIFIPRSYDTRFNSIYSMLNSCEKNFEKLTEFARRNKEDKILNKLISIDKKLLTSYIKILALFNDATLELSYNESPTIQKVIPIRISLEDMCEIEENELEDIITFKFNLKNI